MEQETIEKISHKIIIDEYIEVTLKIPKVITAMGLKALMLKANKLFNLSDALVEETSKKRSYNYTKKPGRPVTTSLYVEPVKANIPKTKRKNLQLWDDEKLIQLKRETLYNTPYKVKAENMNRIFNTDVFTVKNVKKKYYNLRQNNKWNKIKVTNDE
jgi:hypothetical protein